MKKALLTLVASVVAVALGASSLPAAEKAAAFPPAPPKVSPIQGAIDFHVHSAPDVFGRNVNDFEVARSARRAGMRGIVLKNHITTTADRAALVTAEVPGIEVFGGIVLNRAVGGINPIAVEWMHRIEGGRGKVVWFPTFEADHHKKTFGGGEGITVMKDGQLKPEAVEVLEIIARENLVLHTGHVTPTETALVGFRGGTCGLGSPADEPPQLGIPEPQAIAYASRSAVLSRGTAIVASERAVAPGLSIAAAKRLPALG